MKYIYQLAIVLAVSFVGEILNALIPLPIPASIYGMALLFLSLALKVLKVEAVKETGAFLVGLLPLLFVVPTVGLMGCWDLVQDNLLQIVILIVVTTVLTFGLSGALTRLFHKDGDADE